MIHISKRRQTPIVMPRAAQKHNFYSLHTKYVLMEIQKTWIMLFL